MNRLAEATLEDAIARMLTRARKEPGHEETVTAVESAVALARAGAPGAERVQ
jgi:hypothetical protein